jgi:signal-transduction protein with cAMP-binding, CBS, and nucleotidyltransferase domain
MPDVIHEMTSKRLGMTCVADDRDRLLGIVTDGDLRRHMATGRTSSASRRRRDDAHPVTVNGSTLAAQAIHIMEERKITSLVVVGSDGSIEGVVHLHDLWRTEDDIDQMSLRTADLAERAQRVRLLLLDVDGVLIGWIRREIGSNGQESKTVFHS